MPYCGPMASERLHQQWCDRISDTNTIPKEPPTMYKPEIYTLIQRRSTQPDSHNVRKRWKRIVPVRPTKNQPSSMPIQMQVSRIVDVVTPKTRKQDKGGLSLIELHSSRPRPPLSCPHGSWPSHLWRRRLPPSSLLAVPTCAQRWGHLCSVGIL